MVEDIVITSPMEWWSRPRNPLGYRARGPRSRSGASVRVGELAAQRVRPRGRDRDVGVRADERRIAGEIDDAIVLGPAGELVRRRARRGR